MGFSAWYQATPILPTDVKGTLTTQRKRTAETRMRVMSTLEDVSSDRFTRLAVWAPALARAPAELLCRPLDESAVEIEMETPDTDPAGRIKTTGSALLQSQVVPLATHFITMVARDSSTTLPLWTAELDLPPVTRSPGRSYRTGGRRGQLLEKTPGTHPDRDGPNPVLDGEHPHSPAGNCDPPM
ncbi:unnamed protein product [Lota lota]